jgi:hypothetical protein
MFQCFATGLWFSLGASGFSINVTDPEILLTLACITKYHTQTQQREHLLDQSQSLKEKA